ADGARSGTGTGLGLAIVAAIAQAHGGTAHAANRPQGGADVWLSLPAP
ncbi:MAG: sensor histidine kinase, partial [Thermoleophilia bacterium]